MGGGCLCGWWVSVWVLGVCVTGGCVFTGFEMKEKVYRNFPEALLQWKLALEVVSVVIKAVKFHGVIQYIVRSEPFHSQGIFWLNKI